MNMPLLKEKSDLFCKVEKNEIWLTKIRIVLQRIKKADLVNKNKICFVKDKKRKKEKEKRF